MDIIQEVLKNGRYKQQLDNLDNETLRLIAEDHIQALKAAQKGMEKEEPEKVNDVEYLQIIADNMQKLANIVLSSRISK